MAAILLAAAALAGCGREPARDAAPAPSRRIVSLSPAISRTLVDLGLDHLIVGRSAFCASIDERVPIVGDLRHVDYERLLRLEPTDVLVQPPAAGVDPALLDLAAEHGWTIGQWRLNTCADIRRLVTDLPGTLFPNRGAERDDLDAVAASVLARIDEALRPPTGPAWRGRVLLLDGTAPVTVYGRETYLDEVASALGATNAVDMEGWKELSMEDVARLDPEAMILVDPDLPADVAPREAFGPLAGLDVAAVRDERWAVLRHPDAWLPSSGIVGVSGELASILRSFGDGER
jgi:ABC-type hemin transport system substrate-binding protein